MTEDEKWAEAEQYFLQATFILNELQANIRVYGSNSAFSGANPANVGLALQYINRSLSYFPGNPKYLNLAALLLAEGAGRKADAVRLLEKANRINPRDITVANNLRSIDSSRSGFSIILALIGATVMAGLVASMLVSAIPGM